MKLASVSAALLALASVSAARAQDVIATANSTWAGWYAGLNAGGAWNNTCNSWTPSGAITDPAFYTAFNNRTCPNNGTFIGGAQFGYNFQFGQIVWGFGADYDYWSSNNHNRSFTYTGTGAPAGTYAFSGNVTPSGFGLIHPRIGYAIDEWLPYFTAGTIIAGGSHTSTLSFTPAGGGTPAVFNGGKTFTSTGFIVGFGVEYGVSSPLSIRVEYDYANLGKGSNSVTTCSASAAACAEFANISLDSVHHNFTANLVRVGFNYRFGNESTHVATAPVAEPGPAYVARELPPPPPAPAPAPAPCHAPPGFKVDANCQIIEQSVIVRAIDFEFDSTRLTVPAQQTLDEVATALLSQHDLHVEIQGHTDSIGSDAYNLNLSQRRADAVQAYLIDRGLSASALTTKGYGKDKPIATNDTGEGRAQNRRVAFDVTNAPAHVNILREAASSASTDAAEQGQKAKPKSSDR
jgi:outer membrane protein OmpA-like peptidoglycan-associated protein